MGMFDTIEVHREFCPEPRPSWFGEDLTLAQTKSIESNLCHFRVTENGFLEVFKRAGDEYELYDFTGEIVFYYFPIFGHPLDKHPENLKNKPVLSPWYEAMLLVKDGKVIATKHLRTQETWEEITSDEQRR